MVTTANNVATDVETISRIARTPFNSKIHSLERERIFSGGGSSSDFPNQKKRGVEGEKEEIGDNPPSLPEMFETTFGIPYGVPKEKLSRAAWMFRHKPILDYLHNVKITWLSRLHREITDMGYEISKTVLYDLLDALVDDGLIYELNYYPNTGKVHHHRFYITYDCPESKIEKYLERLRKKDICLKDKRKKSADEIEQDTYKRAVAQMKGYERARKHKQNNDDRVKIRDAAEIDEIQEDLELYASKLQYEHKCTSMCVRDPKGNCANEIRLKKGFRKQRRIIAKKLSRLSESAFQQIQQLINAKYDGLLSSVASIPKIESSPKRIQLKKNCRYCGATPENLLKHVKENHIGGSHN